MFSATGSFYILYKKFGHANEKIEMLSGNEASMQAEAQIREDQQQQVDEEAEEGEKSPLKVFLF